MNISLSVMLVSCCCICVALEIIEKKQNKYFAIILCIVEATLVSLRDPYIVPDTIAYTDMYNAIGQNLTWTIVRRNFSYEPGYLFINYLGNLFHLNIETFFCIVALLQVFVFIYGNKKIVQNIQELEMDCNKENISKSFMYGICSVFYISYYGILYSGVILRAGCAISLAFVAYALYIEKNKVFSFFLLLASLLFHKSVLFLYIGMLLTHCLKCKKKKHFHLWLFGILVFWILRVGYLLSSLINNVLFKIGKIIPTLTTYWNAGYGTMLMNEGMFSRKNIFLFFIAMILIHFRPSKNEVYDKLLKIFMVGLTTSVLLNQFSSGYRVADLFIIFSIPLLYYCVCMNKKVSSQVKLLLSFVVIIANFTMSLRIAGFS